MFASFQFNSINIRNNGLAKVSAQSFNIFGCIPSGPQALSSFNCCNFINISSSVNVISFKTLFSGTLFSNSGKILSPSYSIVNTDSKNFRRTSAISWSFVVVSPSTFLKCGMTGFTFCLLLT